jgi:hypothetical protein
MNDTANTQSSRRRQTGRSPAYPFISVKKALEQAKALYDQEGEYATHLSSAMHAWGYGEKSSGGRQTLATLKYYGLIDIDGEGDARKIKVSEIARRILLDERSDDTEKRQLIRRVALNPTAHKVIYEEYQNGLASDGSVEHFLVFEQDFKSTAAKELLAEFKETADYAGLYQPEKLVDKTNGGADNEEDDVEPPRVTIGDKIQCTVNGVDIFNPLATVLGISDDGLWVFTDQSDSGSPLKEVIVIEPANKTPSGSTPPPIPPHLAAARQQTVLPEGQSILSQGKLRDGSFEVRVTGEIGAREIGKIIKVLEAQKEILGDDNEATD